MIDSIPGTEYLFERVCYEHIEERLELTSKLLDHVRVSRDLHIASGQVRLKELAVEKCQEDVREAAETYPVKSLRQLDKIVAKMDENKAKALDLQHKKAFMQNQLNSEVERKNDPATDAVKATDAVSAGAGKRDERLVENADNGKDPAKKARSSARSPSVPTSPGDKALYGPAKVEAAGGAKEFECPVCLGTAEEELCLFSTCGHAFCR